MIDNLYEFTVLAFAAFTIPVFVKLFRWTEQLQGRLQQIARLMLIGLVAWVATSVAMHFGIVARNFPAPYYVRAGIRISGTVLSFCLASGAILEWLVRRLFGRRTEFDPGRRRLLTTVRAGAFAAPFAIGGYGAFVERTNFRTVEVDVPVRGLSPDLNGLRIAQISDIHLSPLLSESELARVVDAANELRPHLIFVTGDLVTKQADPLHVCLRQIQRLRADAAVLGCMGNHEEYARAVKHIEQWGHRTGIEFLRSRARLFRFGNAKLNVAGVDYEEMSKRGRYLQGAEELVEPDAFNLLLSHNPDVLDAAVAKGFDLTVSGHTHGGQINFEILHPAGNIARFYTPYVYGLYKSEQAGRSGYGYVTRGIGTIAVPLRLGAPPEIALIRLRAV